MTADEVLEAVIDREPDQHDSIVVSVAEREALVAELRQLERLREATRVQWKYNHTHQCGTGWPHDVGERCQWPLPIEIGGHSGEFRPYAPTDD